MSELGADIRASWRLKVGPCSTTSTAVILAAVGGTPFHHVMLIDGNDERGIDVALMTRKITPSA